VFHPEQLMALQTNGPCRGSSRGWNPFSHPMYRYLEKENTVCQGIVASFPAEANISYAGVTERTTVMLVSGNYFQSLGLVASLGRPLLPDDDLAPGASPVIVLSCSFWQRRFGGDERILNQTVIINEQAFTIVGVTAPGFRGMEFGRSFDVMTPIAMKAQVTPSWNDLDNRRSLWLNLFGRLEPRGEPEAGGNCIDCSVPAQSRGRSAHD
jgi:hypothetical protein